MEYFTTTTMASTLKTATILDLCRVAPPAQGGAATEQSLPLTFFDIGWLYFHPIQRLLFYQFPCSKTHFLKTIVPNLKNSLSQTLEHFLPLAGNLIFPPNSKIPEFQYIAGDSVSVTVAESSNEASDFNYLTSNQPRVADEFYAFVPDLPEPVIEPESGSKRVPLFSVQITLFPDTGISIGFINHHAIGDASSIVRFIKAWSSIAKLGVEINELLLPFYDRSVIKDPSGIVNIHWNQMRNIKLESSPLNFPTNKVRATYILRREDILHLKNIVRARKPDLIHLSSFTTTIAYVWSCLAKSTYQTGERVQDDDVDIFAFAVDARGRMTPTVPEGYFGNCLAFAYAYSTFGELRGDDGFFAAAEVIGEVIIEKVNNKDELFKDVENWLNIFGSLVGKRSFGVAGSPKFDLYDVDFGWGKPKKHESVSIDGDGSMSLCKSREFEGGLEIGFSLPKMKMDAFADIFSTGLLKM